MGVSKDMPFGYDPFGENGYIKVLVDATLSGLLSCVLSAHSGSASDKQLNVVACPVYVILEALKWQIMELSYRILLHYVYVQVNIPTSHIYYKTVSLPTTPFKPLKLLHLPAIYHLTATVYPLIIISFSFSASSLLLSGILQPLLSPCRTRSLE